MPVSKKDIDNTLVSSGYKPDSALAPNDIKELAKLVRGDEVIDGTVTRNGGVYRVNARLFLPRDAAISQPLISTEGDQPRRHRQADRPRVRPGAEADPGERGVRERTSAPRRWTVAIAAARKGISTYPKATIARLCLASAYQVWKNGPDSTSKPWAKDSVLAIATAITALDKQSKIAYQQHLRRRTRRRATPPKQMEALVGLMNSDPTNATLREQVIAELVTSGKASDRAARDRDARPENPGDPQYLRTRWLVLRAAQALEGRDRGRSGVRHRRSVGGRLRRTTCA